MTPGLIKAIRCLDHTFLNLQTTRSDIMPHIKWAVSLVIAYGHFDVPQGFVDNGYCVYMVHLNILNYSIQLGLL